MIEKRCEQCENFVQHYGLCEGRLFQLYCGHCRRKDRKTRNPQKKACDAFVQGTSDASQFVTKQFLTEALLRRVLELPLLPEIERVREK